MTYTKKFCGVLVLLVASSAFAGADEPAGQPKAPPDSDVRLRLLRQFGERVQVARSDGGKLQPVKILPEPLYRYSEKSRNCPDAVVWAWSDGGRPKALLTLSCQFGPKSNDLRYEFDSLSDKPLVCTIDGQERWRPHWSGNGDEDRFRCAGPRRGQGRPDAPDRDHIDPPEGNGGNWQASGKTRRARTGRSVRVRSARSRSG